MKTLNLIFSVAGLFFLTNLCAQDDCFYFDAGDSLFVSCDSSCTVLSASFTELMTTSAYVIEEIDDFEPPFPIDEGTNLFVGTDDVYSGLIPITFDFCFFGQTYSNAVVGSNGIVSFNASDASGYCPWSFSASCPSPNLETNVIFCPYHDMNPASCGEVLAAAYGEAPCRTFVVNFNEVCLFSCSGVQTSSQMVLYESTNVIEVYIVEKPSCGGWNSGNTLIGIQNSSGTTGYAPPGRNTSNWTTSDEAWRFVPSGEDMATVTWFNTDSIVGTGASLNVCPDTSGYYFAGIEYAFCNEPLSGEDCAFYDFNVTGGSFPGEVSWDFTDSTGVIVLSGGAPFTQSICLPNGCYTFNMFDSFGDGWNGALATLITEDNVFLLNASLNGGSSGFETFCATDFVPPDDDPDDDPIIFFLTDSVYVTLIPDDLDMGLQPPPVLCEDDDFYQIETALPDGEWGSSCEDCLDENGLFDIQLVGPGTYTVSYSLPGECGLVTEEVEVIVEALPEVTISGTDLFCLYSDPYALTSNIPNGIWTADCGDCIDSSTGVFNPAEAGPGVYSVEYLTTGNCPVMGSYSVEVEETQTADIDAPSLMCESDTQLMTAGETGGFWSSECGNCINSNTGLFDGNQSGSGTFEITYDFDNFCSIPTTEFVNVFTAVEADIAPVPELCETGETAQIINNGDTGGTWSSDCGSCLDGNQVFDPTVSGPGEYLVTYTITGICSDQDQVEVIVLSQKDATILMPLDLCLDAEFFDADAEDGGGVWTAECDGCIDPSNGFMDLTVLEPGILVVYYEIPGLCGAEDDHEVLVEPCSIIVPNVISPNGDGQNDALVFQNLQYFDRSALQVYNRWGQIVYESPDYKNNWDADGQPEGTYYFILLRGDGDEFSGPLTVLR